MKDNAKRRFVADRDTTNKGKQNSVAKKAAQQLNKSMKKDKEK